MPEIVNCPACDRKLRVPDDLIGQLVKCPTCGTTFTAAVADTPPAPGPPPPPSELERRAAEVPLPPEPLPPAPVPVWPRQPGFLDEEEAYRSRRRPLEFEARSAVEGPSTALLVVGILSLILHLGFATLMCLGFGIAAQAPGRRGRGEEEFILLFYFGYCCVGVVLDILVIVGAQKMKRLESYGLAMTSCILAMLPTSVCCLLGLPFGIWGLVALNQPGVKDVFDS